MQAAGSLKKRRKRNLAKVTGLGKKGYDSSYDNFDINLLYTENPDGGRTSRATTGINGDIRIDISRGSSAASSGEYSRASSRYSRITREPWEPSKFGIDEEANFEYATRIPTGVFSPELDNGFNVFNSKSKEERPCLISKTATNRLKQVCIVGALVWALPWKYNAKEHRIDRWPDGIHRIWQFIWFCFAIQNTLLLGFAFYSFFARVQLDNGSYRPVFMSSFVVFWYLYSISLNTCMHIYRDKFRIYINTLLELNKILVDRYVIHLEGLGDHGQAILACAVPCNFIQLCLSCTLFIVMPFSPWYLYSYIYTPENPWYWLIPGAFQEWVMAGQTVGVFCLLAWISVTHGNSIEFWLTEAHQNNDTGYTIDEIREPHKAIELYRSLQVLTGLLNECISPMAFPIMKMVNWTAVISCGYVLIRSMNHKFIEEFPAILTYPFGFIVCGSCGYGMLQISAEMFDIAQSFLNSWSQTRSKSLRRILVSCTVLRIYVGRFYFVTVSTTVTYFQKTFDFIIDCIDCNVRFKSAEQSKFPDFKQK